MIPFFAALRFLTILPIPARWCGGEDELGRSIPFFTAVGLCIGGLAAVSDYLLRRILPPFPAAVLVVIVLLAASGGLHIDGLADTADGFFSFRTRDRILEIMRDSRTGPMGAAAVACVIALKIAVLASVPRPLRWGTVLLMPVAGRCALAVTMALLPYARTNGGLCHWFLKGRPARQAAWAFAVFAFAAWWALGWMGLVIAGTSVISALLFAGYSYRRIGGFTGDTLGAACELVEMIPALAAAVRSA
ncbi:MAG: adenosylcobinamide-GDP ribazoletransferase [Deltaproteobacteria bacterium]|nr:adenosylcobinamide-GDP ribazoletransferase [Deltaproteobacteria bacterium]